MSCRKKQGIGWLSESGFLQQQDREGAPTSSVALFAIPARIVDWRLG
jgi:hypothetical protein